MHSPLVKLYIPLLIFLSLAILGFTRDPEVPQGQPTQIITTSDYENDGALREFNMAVDNLYQQGCRYDFQAPTAPGVLISTWIEFDCSGAAAAGTEILSTHEFTSAGEWNAAVANLYNRGFRYAFSVSSPPGPFTTTWVEFYAAGAKP